MKVFEVTTEYCMNGDTEIQTTVEYVTSASDTIQSVVGYFTEHCSHYEKELKGVREVLVVVQHIGKFEGE